MRGDRPYEPANRLHIARFTPHARGSTRSEVRKWFGDRVYPACAGIDPCLPTKKINSDRLPRMRGDRPRVGWFSCMAHPFTPHARGSTYNDPQSGNGYSVYPACAGIDHSPGHRGSQNRSLPRMRGDRPQGDVTLFKSSEFTPHARGSTAFSIALLSTFSVYPACAGIDLTS